MVTSKWIFGILVFSVVAVPGRVLAQPSQYPANTTTCEKFERQSRFSIYAVIDAKWKIFYFWSNITEMYPITFSIPTQNVVKKFKDIYETTNPADYDSHVEWDKASLLMKPRPGTEVMFLYAGPPGSFRAIVKNEQRNKERPYPEPLIKFADVRMKLVQRVLGMMCCEDLTAFALMRVDEMPSTEELCVEAASTIGYQGYKGRSYIKIKKTIEDKEL